MNSIDLQPFSNHQWNQAYRHITNETIDFGFVDVWSDTEGAGFLAYASIIDNQTGDPTTIWPF